MNIPEKIAQDVKVVAYEWQKKIQTSRKGQEQDFHDMMLKMLKNPVNKMNNTQEGKKTGSIIKNKAPCSGRSGIT